MSASRLSGPQFGETYAREVRIPPLHLPGTLVVPPGSEGLVLFAHGSGSSRSSPRNVAVADALNRRHIATLLFDLLTPAEEYDRANVFNISLLALRLRQTVEWSEKQPLTREHRIGLFGASTGAAAALLASSRLGDRVAAVVSRGGRPDLAGPALERVRSPTLLIVGGADTGVIELNEKAFERLSCPKSMTIVAGASHLFPEPGAMAVVTALATEWFERYLSYMISSTSPNTQAGV